jgi:ribosomal protein L19
MTRPASVPEMEPNEEISQALDEARQRRKTLHDAIVHLEKSISSPAAGRIPDWTASVLKEMTEVRDAFGQHVMVTEKPDGLYDEILERAPRLETNVRRLREEHPEIVQRIDDTITRLEQVEIGEDTWPLEEARDDLQRFMGSVIRHRQRGADLVWEAYNVDIGGIE